MLFQTLSFSVRVLQATDRIEKSSKWNNFTWTAIFSKRALKLEACPDESCGASAAFGGLACRSGAQPAALLKSTVWLISN